MKIVYSVLNLCLEEFFMRKSKIAKFLALATLLLATFSFIACGGNGAGGGDDSGNGSGGNGGGSGSSGGSGSEYKALTEEEIVAKFKQLGDYVFGYETQTDEDSESDYFEIGRKENTYWALYSGSGIAYVLDGEFVYCYDDEDSNWTYRITMPSETLESSLDSLFSSALTGFNSAISEDSTFSKVNASEKVAGRTCTHYQSTVPYGPATYKTDIWVDNATEIIMKVISTYSGGGVTNVDRFEVTKFLTGNAVTAPALPDPPED